MSKQDSLNQQTQLLKEITAILDKIQGFDSEIDNINKKLKNGKDKL